MMTSLMQHSIEYFDCLDPSSLSFIDTISAVAETLFFGFIDVYYFAYMLMKELNISDNWYF